uniref:Capsid protein n=1 Tax=Ciconia boyciana parvo-like hybrid virus TaxID=2794504 RepID=A0A8A4XE16_9VIRU|nr:MAG: capsid protein [Ciconia boyciana parvo-like hybrid virus]
MAKGRLRGEQRVDQGRGFVPNGYDYLGPGNDLNRGPPRNKNDAVAQDHDQEYGRLDEENRAPYRLYSNADERFLDNLEVNDIPTAAAKGIFGTKKALNRVGLLDSADSEANLRGRAQMARGRSRFDDETRAESMRNRREQGRQGREDEGGTTRRFRTEGTDLEGALIAVGNDPGNDSLLDLPGTQDNSQGRLGSNDPTTLDDMEVDRDGRTDPQDNQLAVGASAMSGGGGIQGQSKETPISIPPSITYGLQETHTTILPWTGYVSVVNLDYAAPVQLPIRMNGVNDLMPLTTLSNPAQGAAFGGKGIYGAKATEGNLRSYYDFPANFAAGSTDPTERPAWREYWFSLYDYYTVLKCHWEIVVDNPTSYGTGAFPILVGSQYDSYSDTATSTGNVMPLTRLIETMAFKGLKWENCSGFTVREQQGRDNNQLILSGTWMPGMVKRNIVNDGDVKTWTQTNGTIPNLKEILTTNFFLHPLAHTSVAGTVINANVQINLKYVVQLKDLKLQARYPNTVITNQDIQLNLNEFTGSPGSAHQLPNV